MAKVNEQQVLQYLRDRKDELTSELAKIESALTALTGAQNRPLKAEKRKYTRRAGVVTAEKKERSTRGGKKSTMKAYADTPLEAASRRSKIRKKATSKINNSKGGWDQKIISVLGNGTSATKDEVVKLISEQESGVPAAQLGRGISLRLAVLAKSGNINKKEENGVAFYSLS